LDEVPTAAEQFLARHLAEMVVRVRNIRYDPAGNLVGIVVIQGLPERLSDGPGKSIETARCGNRVGTAAGHKGVPSRRKQTTDGGGDM